MRPQILLVPILALVLATAVCLAALLEPCNPGILDTTSSIRKHGGRVVFDFEQFDGSNPAAEQPDASRLEALFMARGSRPAPRAIFVRLYGEQFDDRDLKLVALLRDIEGVSVASGRVTDEGLQQLCGLQRLGRLWLLGTQVTGRGLACIARLPALRYLNLGGSPVGDDGLAALAPAGHLRDLTFNSGVVSDEGIARVARLPALERLSIAGTNIAGSSLRHLVKASKLRSLELGTAQLDREGLALLPAIPHLAEVWVRTPEVSGEQIAKLRELPGIKVNVSRMDL